MIYIDIGDGFMVGRAVEKPYSSEVSATRNPESFPG